jgi:predicted NAD-dependent protein-ADP-ribosyltransferase YbiA (DUF1768 family)
MQRSGKNKRVGSGRASATAVFRDGRPSADAMGAVFFYGRSHRNGYLSQMYTSPFEEDGRMFSCNEQYFQAAKAAFFGDETTKEEIMGELSPFAAKAHGRKVRPFSMERWSKGEESLLQLFVTENTLTGSRSV